MRTFVFGAVIGSALTGLVAYAMWPQPQLPALAGIGSTAALPKPAPVAEAQPRPVAGLASAKPAPSTAATLAVASAALIPVMPAPSTPPPATPSVASVKLSAEHAAVLSPGGRRRPPTLPDLHEEFVGQQKDPVWSPAIEDSLRQAIAAANATGEFEVMTVDCRATLCEVLAFGNLPSSGDKWMKAFSEMTKQPWYADSIKGESTSSAVTNNRYVIATILQRKK